MRLFLPVFAAAALLQACVSVLPVPVPQPAPPADLTSCHAMGLDGLIGQPASLIPADGAWSTLRVIRPGMMITMDYSATRLNVRVDAANIILALNCG